MLRRLTFGITPKVSKNARQNAPPFHFAIIIIREIFSAYETQYAYIAMRIYYVKIVQ